MHHQAGEYLATASLVTPGARSQARREATDPLLEGARPKVQRLQESSKQKP